MDGGTISVNGSGGSPTTIFGSAGDSFPCTSYSITNTDTANGVGINVAGMHAAGVYFPLAAGATQIFRMGHNRMTLITGLGLTTSAVVVSGGIVAKM
jgi:hypothetical protein